MLVQDIMTKKPATIQNDDLLVKAYKLMKEQRLRHLPVINKKGDLVGILAHRDILNATQSYFEDRSPKELSNVFKRCLCRIDDD